MDADTFWDIVEAARADCEDETSLDEFADALTDHLCRGDEDEAVAFGAVLVRLAREVESFLRGTAAEEFDDLAPHVIQDVVGRLVSNGRAAFDVAADHPDQLRELIVADLAEFDGASPDPAGVRWPGTVVFEAPYDAYGRILGDEEGYLEGVAALLGA